LGIREFARKLTIKVKVIHPSDISLSLATEEAHTVGFSAITWLWIMASKHEHTLQNGKNLTLPITVHIVIEGEFLIFPYVPICKDAHADVLSNCPFRNVAVRITAMICKSADTASLCCIDVLDDRQKIISGQWRNRMVGKRTSSFCNIIK
jgi:hypothetical protein